MEQVSFLLKCCADQGLPNWRKILLLLAAQGLEGGHKTLATHALLQHCIGIAQFLWVGVGIETFFLPESCTVQ